RCAAHYLPAALRRLLISLNDLELLLLARRGSCFLKVGTIPVISYAVFCLKKKNIFGGIVRCDMVARGVVGAANNLGVKVPVVVRLEGTNVEEGQRVIRDSGLNFTVASGMKDAAEKVVALAG